MTLKRISIFVSLYKHKHKHLQGTRYAHYLELPEKYKKPTHLHFSTNEQGNQAKATIDKIIIHQEHKMFGLDISTNSWRAQDHK